MNTRLKTFSWVFYFCSLGGFLYYLEYTNSYFRPGFWDYFLILVILIVVGFAVFIAKEDSPDSTLSWYFKLFLVYFPALYYFCIEYFYFGLFGSTLIAVAVVIVYSFLIMFIEESFLPWAKPFFESEEEKEMRRKQEEEEREKQRTLWEIERKTRERNFLEVEVPKLKEELEFLKNKLKNLEEQEIYINYDPQQRIALRDEKHLVVVRINEINRILNR